MSYNKVVRGKVNKPSGLPAIDSGLLHKALEVVVVRPNFNSMPATFEVVAPMFKGFYYCHKLLIRGRVIGLSPFKLLGEKGNRVPLVGICL